MDGPVRWLDPEYLWKSLPTSIRSGIHQTRLIKILRLTNSKIRKHPRFIEYRYDIGPVPVQCGGLSTNVTVPRNLNPIWREYEEHKCHEPLTTKLLVDEISNGDVVWDFGARLGYFSQIAAVLNKSPENIYAFEAQSKWSSILQVVNEREFDGLLHINTTRVGDTDSNGETTGDSYAKEHGAPDFVKIDIEGAELNALKGMDELLSEKPPIMVIEGHPEDLQKFGQTDEELLDYLNSHYNNIQISFEYRNPSGKWQPVEEYWDRRLDVQKSSTGYDSVFQLYCFNL